MGSQLHTNLSADLQTLHARGGGGGGAGTFGHVQFVLPYTHKPRAKLKHKVLLPLLSDVQNYTVRRDSRLKATGKPRDRLPLC